MPLEVADRLRPLIAGRGERELLFRSTTGTILDPDNLADRVLAPACSQVGAAWAGAARCQSGEVSSMRSSGATVIEHGADFDDARERCEELSAQRGARYIHSGNEPLLMIVVIGAQSDGAPAAYRAWREHRPFADEMHTFAEGLQTRVSFELPQRILAEHLDDSLLVTDDEVRAATLQLIELTRTLVEPAGAAPFAAILKLGERVVGERVGLVCSGGNVQQSQPAQQIQAGQQGQRAAGQNQSAAGATR
jgi:threonine dehydratase